MSDWICSDAGFIPYSHVLDWFCSDGKSADWICSDGWVRLRFPRSTDWFCSVSRWQSGPASAKLTDFAPTEGLFSTLWRSVMRRWLNLLRFSGRFSSFDWICSDGKAVLRPLFAGFKPKSPHSADWILPSELTEHAPTCAFPDCCIRQIEMAEEIAKEGGALHCLSWNVYLPKSHMKT